MKEGRVKILVVDEDPFAAKIIKDNLESANPPQCPSFYLPPRPRLPIS
jgi:hypothetical protein